MADDTFAWVRERFAEVLEIDPAEITRESRFADDLDADSIDLIEVVNKAEQERGIAIAEEQLYDLETVGELVDLLAASGKPVESVDIQLAGGTINSIAAGTRAAARPRAGHGTRTDTDTGGRSPDPVANFHLGNGAQLARLCWGANRTHDGVARSLTLMANYLYEPDRLSERAGHYRTEGQVSVGDDVARLLDEASD